MNVVAPLPPDVDLSATMFLVMDDKPFFRDLAHNALVRCRARDVKYAADLDRARETLKRYGHHIGGVVCDWDLAPTGGLELLRLIRAAKLPRTPAETCVVILTARPDAAAVKAAMQLDVNGFAVAPLSIEKLMRTFGQAMARPWKLRAPEHYLAVPAVEVPQAVPEKSAREPSAATTGGEGPARSAAPSGSEAPARKAPAELLNVRMCTLSAVKAGVVLARDLKDRDGHLLLKAGTDITAKLIARLTEVSGNHADSYHVWIGERG
jgi:DNA-binding NarL/FixJ family response regulator